MVFFSRHRQHWKGNFLFAYRVVFSSWRGRMFWEIHFMVAGRFVTRRGEGTMERENSFLSRPLINPLSSGPPYTLDGAHVPQDRGQSWWFISRYYPIMEFFFSSKNSSPMKRRKYFKISLYKILCNNNTGVVRMASKIPRTNIFLLFFFKLFAWKRARKERIVKLFPNYSTIVSILN